jgi:hypothetical protein
MVVGHLGHQVVGLVAPQMTKIFNINNIGVLGSEVGGESGILKIYICKLSNDMVFLG